MTIDFINASINVNANVQNDISKQRNSNFTPIYEGYASIGANLLSEMIVLITYTKMR